MLEAQNLCCSRGDRNLFSDLNFQLEPGTLLYVEGPNGSGKTTLLRAVCGLFMPTDGTLLWQGENTQTLAEEYRKELIYLGHHNGIKLDLSGLENLQIATILDGDKVTEKQRWDALGEMGLVGYEDLPTRVLSQGQKRRVALARLLVSNTRLWILDEPFTALDIAAVEKLQSIIAKHVEQGGIVMLTTHQDVALTSGQVNKLQLGST
jgi:heme exporter protein A